MNRASRGKLSRIATRMKGFLCLAEDSETPRKGLHDTTRSSTVAFFDQHSKKARAVKGRRVSEIENVANDRITLKEVKTLESISEFMRGRSTVGGLSDKIVRTGIGGNTWTNLCASCSRMRSMPNGP